MITIGLNVVAAVLSVWIGHLLTRDGGSPYRILLLIAAILFTYATGVSKTVDIMADECLCFPDDAEPKG